MTITTSNQIIITYQNYDYYGNSLTSMSTIIIYNYNQL